MAEAIRSGSPELLTLRAPEHAQKDRCQADNNSLRALHRIALPLAFWQHQYLKSWSAKSFCMRKGQATSHRQKLVPSHYCKCMQCLAEEGRHREA
eukprot:87198-Pelagomonas_calceolata.AAC.4